MEGEDCLAGVDPAGPDEAHQRGQGLSAVNRVEHERGCLPHDASPGEPAVRALRLSAARRILPEYATALTDEGLNA